MSILLGTWLDFRFEFHQKSLVINFIDETDAYFLNVNFEILRINLQFQEVIIILFLINTIKKNSKQ